MRLRLLMIFAVATVGLVATTAVASANHETDPFLCPIVGDQVKSVADVANGDNGVATLDPDGGDPPAGTSFLPGNNKAGDKANHNALNTEGPGDPDAGPGGNPDYSPIWPG